MRPTGAALGIVVVAFVLALVVAHLVAFRIVSSRLGLSIGATGGVIAVALAAHLGVLGGFSRWIRRRFHGE